MILSNYSVGIMILLLWCWMIGCCCCVWMVESFSMSSSSPPKKNYFEYQKEGIQRLLKQKRVLLGDEMGLGKTIQCIGALNQLLSLPEKKQKVLIICPKSVMNVWQYELQEWLFTPTTTTTTTTIHHSIQIDLATSNHFPSNMDDVDILIMNYDVCNKHSLQLYSQQWDVVICDEAHYLKSIDSKRTLAILGDGTHPGISSSTYLWFVTGTPLMNRPVELYPLLRALYNNNTTNFLSFDEYTHQYCNPKVTKFGRRYIKTYNGATNLQELSKKYVQPVMLRRYKQDVLQQLPPKIKTCIRLTPSSSNNIAETERQRLQTYFSKQQQQNKMDHHDDDSLSDSFIDFSSESKSIDDYLHTFLNQNKAQQRKYNYMKQQQKENDDDDDEEEDDELSSDYQGELLMGLISTIRKETALQKLEPSIELIQDIISHEKVVVFAHHKELIQQLVDSFEEDTIVKIIGGMSLEERKNAVHQFQTNDKVRIMVGSIRAAGVGLTLTASHHVIFLELDWSPAIMAQAEDRCHRVGQEHGSVLIQYYVFPNTIDEWIAKSLVRKQQNINLVLSSSSRNKNTSNKSSSSSCYTFDFGKYQGYRFSDVPSDYIQFIVRTPDIWKRRPSLWKELYTQGRVTQKSSTDDQETESNHKSSGENLDNKTKSITSDDNTMESTSRINQNRDNYTFDFGKYIGHKLKDVPVGYIEFILRKPNIYKTRIPLWKELFHQGYNVEPVTEDNKTTLSLDETIPSIQEGKKIKQNMKHFAPSDSIGETDSKEKSFSLTNNDNDTLLMKNDSESYIFNFGKHAGKHWNDVPLTYRKWIISKQVWKNRKDLLHALQQSNLLDQTA